MTGWYCHGHFDYDFCYGFDYVIAHEALEALDSWIVQDCFLCLEDLEALALHSSVCSLLLSQDCLDDWMVDLQDCLACLMTEIWD